MMDQVLLAPLNTLESALTTLQTSLTQTNTYTAAPTAATTLIQADTDITNALTLLRRHQQNHQRIQALRAEADTLHNNIKSIIQQCTALRHKAEDIIGHDALNYDSSDDESTASKKKEIDYDTLLSFATRIARENAVAAREAENAFIQRKFDSQPQSNGVNDWAGSSTGEALRTQEASVNLEQALDQHWAMMNARGIAFPNGERLRQGALGRLQYLFEEEGSGGVDKAVKEMLEREAQGKTWEDQDGQATEIEALVPVISNIEENAKKEQTSKASAVATAAQPSLSQPQQPSRPARPPKKKLDLEFPGSDDDDAD